MLHRMTAINLWIRSSWVTFSICYGFSQMFAFSHRVNVSISRPYVLIFSCMLVSRHYLYLIFYALSTQFALICLVWISERTAIISLHCINWLVFGRESVCIYCAVRSVHLSIQMVKIHNPRKSQFVLFVAMLSWRVIAKRLLFRWEFF